MFGISLEVAANVVCDNKSVYNNASFSEPELKVSISLFVLIGFGSELLQV